MNRLHSQEKLIKIIYFPDNQETAGVNTVHLSG